MQNGSESGQWRAQAHLIMIQIQMINITYFLNSLTQVEIFTWDMQESITSVMSFPDLRDSKVNLKIIWVKSSSNTIHYL